MAKRKRRLSRRVVHAADQVAEVVSRAQRAPETSSKQPRFATTVDRANLFTSTYKWLKTSLPEEPTYLADSRTRDRWLSTAWKKEPHLAGVVNSVVGIDKNRGWNIVGGRNQTNRFNAILRGADNGAGWRQYMSQTALSFYTQDLGALTELGRDGPDGPLRSLYFLDSGRCRLTGNSNTPLGYTPADGTKEQLWAPQDFFRVVSLPATDEAFNGLGFCAESRAIQLTRLMIGIYEHDQEMVGARAPRGLLLLQNISEQQWEDAMKARAVKLSQREQEWFGSVAVLAQEGVDQVDAKLIALSQLPANFDLQTFTDLLMYGYALCFGYDPTEFWPVSSGALGRGTETQIQHNKATGKGGLDFILNYQDRLQQQIPDSVFFEFEQRDVNGEIEEATVKQAWANLAATLYDKGVGVLSQEEAKIILAEAGVIPAEWTQNEEDVTIESSGEQRSWAKERQVWAAAFDYPLEPVVRMDQDGRIDVLYGSGMDFLSKHRAHPLARSMAMEYGGRNPAVARDLWGRSFQVVTPLTIEQRATETLFDEDDVTITMEDVTRALENGRKRVGKEFTDFVMATGE